MNRSSRWFLFLLLFISLPVTAQSADDGNRGDALSIRLAVLGPGDALYLSWGHIGVIVEDTLSGQSRFYDYGLFSFDTENFFVNFALGRLIFAVGTSPVYWNFVKAEKDDRELTLMTLNLSGEAKAEMKALLEVNVRPGNNTYLYHHYGDNCATRVRDILDRVTDGQIRRFTADKPGRMTLRAHTLRHLKERPFFFWFLPFMMGSSIDIPITIWDDLFLPSEFLRILKDFTYQDGNGIERPLVSRVETYYYSKNRAPLSEDPPPFPWWIFFVGLDLAAIAWAGAWFIPRREGRLLLGWFNFGLGLFFGGTGSLLFFHEFFYRPRCYLQQSESAFYQSPPVGLDPPGDQALQKVSLPICPSPGLDRGGHYRIAGGNTEVTALFYPG